VTDLESLDRQVTMLGMVQAVERGEMRVKTWPRFDIVWPWGPSDTPWWLRWRWFWGRTGTRGWPCTQVIVGLLYVRVWWPNVLRFYDIQSGALMGAYWLEEWR
jgi:hypothetical protein